MHTNAHFSCEEERSVPWLRRSSSRISGQSDLVVTYDGSALIGVRTMDRPLLCVVRFFLRTLISPLLPFDESVVSTGQTTPFPGTMCLHEAEYWMITTPALPSTVTYWSRKSCGVLLLILTLMFVKEMSPVFSSSNRSNAYQRVIRCREHETMRR